VSVVTQKRAVRLGSFLAGKWVDSTAGDFLPVIDAIWRVCASRKLRSV